MQLSPSLRARLPQAALLIALPVLAFTWAYWGTLDDTRRAWDSNAQYSHGYLVPIFSVVLLWLRRDRCDWEAMRPSWWGVPVLLFGCLLRLAAAWFHFVWFDQLSLLPCVAGLVLALGGWPAWRWAWPSVVFLAFMIPLPFTLATALSSPLQTVATIASTFIMQTLGLPAVSEGNVILVNDARIGVVEACSGLRMLVVFFAMATGMVLVIKRPLVDKIVLVVSAVPIALVSNIIRVTVTGLLYQSSYKEHAETFFHDVGGWLMMPLALGFLWIEMQLLQRLFVESKDRGGDTSGWFVRSQPATPTVPAVKRTPLTPAVPTRAQAVPVSAPARRTPWRKGGPAPV